MSEINNAVPATDPKLLELLNKARQHVMTPAEIAEQRASWVYGQLPESDTRTLTEIKAMCANYYGDPAAAADTIAALQQQLRQIEGIALALVEAGKEALECGLVLPSVQGDRLRRAVQSGAAAASAIVDRLRDEALEEAQEAIEHAAEEHKDYPLALQTAYSKITALKDGNNAQSTP